MTDDPNVPTTHPPLRLFLRESSLWRELAAFWIFLIFVGGYLVGLGMATKQERAICRVRVTNVEKQRDGLMRMLVEAQAKGKKGDAGMIVDGRR